ncbi:hypothetical protein Taro_021089 [Colocasia esculenta]|uniref:Uncharacterized protein n=1 Tax=Colocasia esculenta TaxID=4460 RepID=A0A843UY22_COLES|nr:hypothetical protein [Colocasia esculenta]
MAGRVRRGRGTHIPRAISPCSNRITSNTEDAFITLLLNGTRFTLCRGGKVRCVLVAVAKADTFLSAVCPQGPTAALTAFWGFQICGQGWLWICVGVQCAGHQQGVGVQFWRSTGARGKAVMRAAAPDQAGNDGLEGGVRGKLLGM